MQLEEARQESEVQVAEMPSEVAERWTPKQNRDLRKLVSELQKAGDYKRSKLMLHWRDLRAKIIYLLHRQCRPACRTCS